MSQVSTPTCPLYLLLFNSILILVLIFRSMVKFKEPLSFNVIQVWKNPLAVQAHLQSQELTDMLESSKEYRNSDEFTITKIH
jgi:quinol monooxygenase YgiN